MKKCFMCKGDLIYLGHNNKSQGAKVMGGIYSYICNDCGEVSWSTSKEKGTLKWYNMKERTKELLEKAFKED